jgi:transposase
MQGRHEYQPQLFATINLEQMVPQNHLLRKVENVLDLSFVRDLTKNFYSADNGRPSIDPELFVRMVLLSYFYDIDSERKLCEEVSLNLAYRWYCKLSFSDKIPDHSSFTRIRDRLGEETFRKLFLKIVELCKENGLVKAKQVMIDGSLIKADAAMNSLVAKDATPEEISNRPSCIQGQHYKNETHHSCSDPDATIAGKTGVPKQLYYKVHSTIDGKSRVILDPHVTTGAPHDGGFLIDRIEAVEKTFKIKIKEVVADRAYGSGDNQQYLIDRKINSNIPNFHKDVGLTYDREKFKYNKRKDRFRCPAGFFLYPTNAKSGRPSAKQYLIRGANCKTCPLRSGCFSDDSTNPRKRINTSIHEALQDKIRLKEQTPEFRTKLRERMWKLEGLFAEGKNWHGLSRARYRGRAKMQIQAYLVASVQNLKRVMEVVLSGSSSFMEKNFEPLQSSELFLIFKISIPYFQESI